MNTLDNFGDLIVGVQDGLVASGVSSFYSPDIIKRAIIKAYNEAQNLFQWPMLEKAKEVQGGTIAGIYYYDYPPKFLTNSISRVIINGIPYGMKNFDDFLNWKYQTTNKQSGVYICANFGRQIFIDPTPTANGLEMFLWGLEMAPVLSANGDPTIFTNNEPMGNEAIVKIAIGKLKPRANKKQEGQTEEQEGTAMLATVYQKIMARRMSEQRLNKPMFNVPDLFARANRKGPIGNF